MQEVKIIKPFTSTSATHSQSLQPPEFYWSTLQLYLSFGVLALRFVQVVQARVLLSARVDDQRSLGIDLISFSVPIPERDEEFIYALYGGIVEYERNVDELFSQNDREAYIAGLGLQAVEEASEIKAGLISKGQDMALAGMTVFVIGKEAYFASPVGKWSITKNKNIAPPKKGFVYGTIPEHAPLRQQLMVCQLELVAHREPGRAGIAERHRTNGQCGEIMAMQMWLLQHGGETWSIEKRALAMHYFASTGTFMGPCTGGKLDEGKQTWGCKQWAKYNGVSFSTNGWNKDTVKRSTVQPVKKTKVDTLWCKEWDNRKTEQQLGFRNLDDMPTGLTSKDLEDLLRDASDDDDPFRM